MSKCDFVGCTGHLGKFDSCRDEAVYLLSMDERWDGDVDFGTCWCVIDLDDTLVDIGPGGDEPVMINVPAGVYLVQTDDRGFVYVSRWGDIVGFGDALVSLEAAYGAWLDSED